MSSRSCARNLLVVAGLVGTTLLTGCSSGTTIDQGELETNIAEILAAQVPDAGTPVISCPDDVVAEVGTTFECELTVEGDETILPVYGTVDSVDDGVASYSVEVGS